MNEQTIGTNSQMVTLEALKASKNELERLLETFEAIEDKLDPAPAPKPDKVNSDIFYRHNCLRNELRQIEDAITNLDDAATTLRNRLGALQEKICNGRNGRAWSVILKHAGAINCAHFDAIMQAATLYEQHALFIEKLATFANADCLPDEV